MNEDVNTYFDITPYNYIFNRCTPFIDDNFFKNDHEKLEDVCQNML